MLLLQEIYSEIKETYGLRFEAGLLNDDGVYVDVCFVSG